MTIVIELNSQERSEVLLAMSKVDREYGEEDFHKFFYDCSRASGSLPVRLGRVLFDFRMGSADGVLLIKNLLIPSELPPTPSKKEKTWNPTALAARKMMCIALSQIGHIYNFAEKKYFDYIDDVFPIYKDRDEQLGSNRAFLEWHVEDGFHPAKADLASLFCLRGDNSVQTYICKAKNLALRPEMRDELMKENFLIKVDPTFKSAKDQPSQFRCSVLSAGNDPEIVYDPAYMQGATRESQIALEHVRECIESAYEAITLESGDLLIFDNRRVLHARSSYQPAYDGTDRWLLRGLLLESYWKTRECLDELAVRPNTVKWPSSQYTLPTKKSDLESERKAEV